MRSIAPSVPIHWWSHYAADERVLSPGNEARCQKRNDAIDDGEDAGQLIESIATDFVGGLRDRALIATILYTFARVSTVVGMMVHDYYPQGKRSSVGDGGAALSEGIHGRLALDGRGEFYLKDSGWINARSLRIDFGE
jgi:hypothetical protein